MKPPVMSPSTKSPGNRNDATQLTPPTGPTPDRGNIPVANFILGSRVSPLHASSVCRPRNRGPVLLRDVPNLIVELRARNPRAEWRQMEICIVLTRRGTAYEIWSPGMERISRVGVNEGDIQPLLSLDRDDRLRACGSFRANFTLVSTTDFTSRRPL
jgi:hypothetical protein